jgi:HD-GYP domain-containing protein (c-di-GMP phosphodiesterase class II)
MLISYHSDQSQNQKLRLAEVLSALTYALDITEGQPQGHSVRCCWIGLLIAEELKLDDQQTWELYYTLLLKDLGCSSNAARVCELYLADDLSFKKDFKLVNGSLPQALRFVMSHTGLQSGMAERFRAIINIFQNGGEISRELIETRCTRGADIARKMRFSEPVALGIHNLDEHWDGSGKPYGIKGEDISLYARIALLAQVVDIFRMSSGEDAARKEIENRSGTWFDPALAKAFKTVASRPSFWDAMKSEDLREMILELEPKNAGINFDEDYLDDIAAGFAQVVDAKSPFTKGHSERVALYSDMIAEQLQLTPPHRRWLKRAALLHDIGKLGVSNSILDKPGKLDDAEWVAMRRHSAETELILSRISVFKKMAPVAAAHHERLDGKGYPNNLAGEQISFESRILAVADIFDALTADRPYRAAMPVAKALNIMNEDAGRAIDSDCFAALKQALQKINSSIAA